MAGPVPAIHVLLTERPQGGMPGTRPGDGGEIRDRRSVASSASAQRLVEEPAAFVELVQRGLQPPQVFTRNAARAGHRRDQPLRRRRLGPKILSRELRFGLRAAVAEQCRQQREQAAAALGLAGGGIRGVYLLDQFVDVRLLGPGLPGCLHESDALLADDPLHTTDGVALAVEEMADAAQKRHIVRAVVTAAAAALHWFYFAESAFPKPQHMLWH